MASGRVAACFALGVGRHGALDRYAVPVGHFRPTLEPWMPGRFAHQLRDHVSSLAVLDARFEAERQVGSGAAKRLGQDELRMEVAHLRENRQHLVVKLGLGDRPPRRAEPPLQQPQSLDGIDGVHRTLQRKMDVERLDQRD